MDVIAEVLAPAVQRLFPLRVVHELVAVGNVGLVNVHLRHGVLGFAEGNGHSAVMVVRPIGETPLLNNLRRSL